MVVCSMLSFDSVVRVHAPLTYVLNATALLSRSGLKERRLSLIRAVALSSRRLSGLVSGILSLGHVRRGGLFLRGVPISIRHYIGRITSLFQASLAHGGLSLVVSVSTGMSP